ncbi:MAG: gfo/Idh/MocA family oxidoreductase, partial [Bacteroidota bacterium]
EEPNTLIRTYTDRPTEILRSAQGYLSDEVNGWFRTPPGHPEGYIEAFANVYLDFASAIRAGRDVTTGVAGALRGMAFIEALVASSNNQSAWTEISA